MSECPFKTGDVVQCTSGCPTPHSPIPGWLYIVADCHQDDQGAWSIELRSATSAACGVTGLYRVEQFKRIMDAGTLSLPGMVKFLQRAIVQQPEPAPVQSLCRNCRFVEPTTRSAGYCRRFPPLANVAQPMEPAEYPVVFLNGWCGEHKPGA